MMYQKFGIPDDNALDRMQEIETPTRSANRHFALTMEHSLDGSHKYCGSVIHGARINDKLEHFSDEFFESLKHST